MKYLITNDEIEKECPAAGRLCKAVRRLSDAINEASDDLPTARNAVANMASDIHDCFVQSDRLSELGLSLKNLATNAVLLSAEDQDNPESRVDGAKVIQASRKVLDEDPVEYLKKVSEGTGKSVEYLVANSATFTLASLSKAAGLTAQEMENRFGGWTTVKNAPSVRRTW